MVRTEFQRDRDRIIHCKSFRRLKHKTQVFIAPPGDHYVTRLTHTLEVAQIARTIARALNLNEDLTEAIALGHDLGHTPFGHAGEEALARLLPRGFRHNEQSLRVVDLLEKDGEGLNLTWEVREGILKHSKVREDILAEGWGTASTLEGQICKVADSVAYINHDIGDAIRAGLTTEDDLPREAVAILGVRHSQRINTLVCDIIDSSWAATGEDEACYLTAILNSETARSRVAHMQSRGQWGARDFDKLMFELPIPRFDSANARHQALAAAAKEAEAIAAHVPLAEAMHFVTARRRIRAALREDGVAQRIDALVAELLGDGE